MLWNTFTWSAIGVPYLYFKRINFLIKNILLVPYLWAYNSSNFCHNVCACVSSMIWFKTLSSTHYQIKTHNLLDEVHTTDLPSCPQTSQWRCDKQPIHTSLCEDIEESFNQNQCIGNINTSMCTSDIKIYVKTSSTWGGKTRGVNQPVHASFTMSNLGTESSLESLEISTHFITLPTNNNNNNHRRQDYSKAEISQLLSSLVISKLLFRP
jgi:hypothetical protein